MKRKGFTLIELLVVILILAVLMAIALPLYLRAVKDSEKQTCRSNMQTIAHAEQAYRIRDAAHNYTEDMSELIGITADLVALPRCPSDSGADTGDDYTVEINDNGSITIRCNCDNAEARAWHNNVDGDADHGFIAGLDSE